MWLVSSLCCDVESSVLIFFLIFSCPSSHSVSRSTSLFPCQDHIHAWHYRFFLPAILGEMSGTKQIADGLWTRECWINPLPRIQKWAFLELYLCSLPEYACLMEDQGEALVIFFFFWVSSSFPGPRVSLRVLFLLWQALQCEPSLRLQRHTVSWRACCLLCPSLNWSQACFNAQAAEVYTTISHSSVHLKTCKKKKKVSFEAG